MCNAHKPVSGRDTALPILIYACLQAKDSNGETPIIAAMKNKHANAAQLLTDALRWPKVTGARRLPMPYNVGMHMPTKRRSLDRPECY